MDLFELVAKIRLDSSEYESGLAKSKKSMGEYRSDVMKLAQTYKAQGMSMSDAMKKAYAEIDKSQYETAEESERSSKKFIGNWSNASEKLGKIASGVGKGLATVAKVGAAAVSAGAAGVAALTKIGVEGYAQYEQLVGGVETLFKTSSSAVMGYAENAYKTAGMSANQYMETVTSFSASLIQSLDGDTAKAAKVADIAITDMSDNANKMGTSMEMIQNAYQGFAKQNYTMLDNLKLGYGGTKEEMQRLIDDANAVKAANGEMADLSIDSFADVTEAIHIVQTEMGITGTTAKEAASTIEGSISMMKGAWQNLVVGMADENANMEVLIGNFVESTATAAGNLLPRISQALAGIGEVITGLAPVIAKALPMLVETVLPSLLTAGASLVSALVNGIIEAAPAVLQSALDAIKTILVEGFGVSAETASATVGALETAFKAIGDAITFVTENIETIIGVLATMGATIGIVATAIAAYNAVQAVKTAMDAANTTTLWGLVSAKLADAAATMAALAPYIAIVAAIVAVIAIIVLCVKHWDEITAAISEAWSKIKEKTAEAVDALTNWISSAWNNIKTATKNIWNGIKSAISSVWDGIKFAVSDAINNVKFVVSNVFNGVKSTVSNIWNGIKTTISGVWDGIKSTVSSAIDNVKSKISTGLETAKNTISRVLDTIKGKFSDIFEGAKKIVTDAIEAIKGAFDFEWSLPDLKLPHISVYGGKAPYGIGGKGSLPSFSIEWYKKAYDNAMILSSPTIFGYSDGKFLGGGDGNGNEIIAGESYLMRLISNAVEVKNEKIVALLGALLEATVDGNTETVRALMADRTFAVGEREFARLVKQYA